MDEARWLNPAESRAWRGYLRMHTLLGAQIARDLAQDSGLSDSDYTVLSNLSEAPGRRCRINELGARMLWSKSRLSHQLTRMEQRGLVTREDCPSDARGAYVVLTDDGWQAIVAAAPSHVDSVRRHLVDLLSEEEITALGSIAEKVVAHLAGQPPDGAAVSRHREGEG